MSKKGRTGICLTIFRLKGGDFMAVSGLYGNSIGMMSKALDFLWEKESVISNNLANVETPGYKAQYVTFEEEFQNRLKAASADPSGAAVRDAVGASRYTVHTSRNETARADGNNVNADSEMMELTRTSLQYQYLLRSVSSDISRLNTVITGQ